MAKQEILVILNLHKIAIARNDYVNFSNEQTALKAMRSSYLRRQNFWIPIKKCEIEISIKKGSVSPSIKRIQFPLKLS